MRVDWTELGRARIWQLTGKYPRKEAADYQRRFPIKSKQRRNDRGQWV